MTNEQILVPARMLNEFTYCPRLGYLMWVDSEWRDNYYTEDGRWQHRRVDEGGGKLPEPDDLDADLAKARAVTLSAPLEGLIAGMDVVEAEQGVARPVDFKRGRLPNVENRAYDPERVQLCAQGLVLRENGWKSDGGWLYYVASRTRVWVPFDDDLVALTRTKLAELRIAVAIEPAPPPLVDSPKCHGCSLVGICLPDEVNWLRSSHEVSEEAEPVRRLWAPRPDALPLYLQKPGLMVGISGETLVVKEKGEVVHESRFLDVSQVNLVGNVQISTQAVRELCSREIPITWFSSGGWYYGTATGAHHKNIALRRAQFRHAFSASSSLRIARSWVHSKILNSRTLLRRNHTDLSDSTKVELKRYAQDALKAKSLESLLGIEGMAARIYFEAFAGMFKGKGLAFDLEGRNRRPPRDPINAMLSYLYAILTKDCQVTLQSVGFDPYQGFYHQPKYGKPALALDLMEEFRPLIVDSTVVWAINNGVIEINDFVRANGSVSLKAPGKKRLVEAYERRMDTLVTHPTFGYRVSYRRLLEVQARLLARYLQGEVEQVPTFQTR